VRLAPQLAALCQSSEPAYLLDELADLARAGAAFEAQLHGTEPGTIRAQTPPDPRAQRGRKGRAPDTQSTALPPRLLTLREAAAYCAVSYWTVRTWVDHGHLTTVRLPGGGKLLRVERAAVDQLINQARESTP
jgi:excisionase family DNA binding protein